jgi:DNA-binding NarL/FixJ family response regulator
MDIRMPKLDGLEATRRILAADDTARILILTTFDLDEYVYEALRAWAAASSSRTTVRNSAAALRVASCPLSIVRQIIYLILVALHDDDLGRQ